VDRSHTRRGCSAVAAVHQRELVQLAIVTKGDTAKALARLKKMAAWRTDLSLDDVSFADAFRTINTTVMASGYGILTPYGRAQSGSGVLCAWYSV
jgi:hypothetical protein